VACLHCGKVIGAFRLLRDSEFCCPLHRVRYRERLGKALHDIATPEPAPAAIAGFLDEMPYQTGNCGSTLILFQTIASEDRIQSSASWPLTLDLGHGTSAAAARTPSVSMRRVRRPEACRRSMTRAAYGGVVRRRNGTEALRGIHCVRSMARLRRLDKVRQDGTSWSSGVASWAGSRLRVTERTRVLELLPSVADAR